MEQILCEQKCTARECKVPCALLANTCKIVACRINAAIAELAGTVRENIRIRRAVRCVLPKDSIMILSSGHLCQSYLVWLLDELIVVLRLDAPKGAVASYLHISPAAGLGRIGSLVAIEGKDGPLPSSSIPDVMVRNTLLWSACHQLT